MAIFDRGILVTLADGYPTVEKQITKVTEIRALTQVQYDALKQKERNTLYIIVPE